MKVIILNIIALVVVGITVVSLILGNKFLTIAGYIVTIALI